MSHMYGIIALSIYIKLDLILFKLIGSKDLIYFLYQDIDVLLFKD